MEEIKKLIEKIAKEHNIKDYTIEILLWQDDTRQVIAYSHEDDYKITIELKNHDPKE